MKIIENKIFLVKTDLSVYPLFYVEALDILDATKKSKSIVEYFGKEKTVITISILNIPVLSKEDENED